MEPPPKDGGQVRQAPGLTRRRTRPQAGCRSAGGARFIEALFRGRCAPTRTMKLEPQTARSEGVRFAADEAQRRKPPCGTASVQLEARIGTRHAARRTGWLPARRADVRSVGRAGSGADDG